MDHDKGCQTDGTQSTAKHNPPKLNIWN